MQLQQQYHELQRLKAEINVRLAQGVDFHTIKELIIFIRRIGILDQGWTDLYPAC